jgi:SAM-dependent methyltransferase
MSAEELRPALRAQWSAAASGWRAHHAHVDQHSAPVTAAMLRSVNIRPGDRVLELACGPGGVGLAAARRAGPDGHVVLSDIAPEMTAIASDRASELGLANVETKQLDLEAIAEPDASYDVVLCRNGLMLVPDPERAAAEIARVLRPRGSVAVAVWAPRERNPWLGALLDAVGTHLGAAVPPPGVPGPFSMSELGAVRRVLASGGLLNVTVEEVAVPLAATSPQEWLDAVIGLGGTVRQLLASLPPQTVEAIRGDAIAAVAPYARNGGAVEIPGAAYVASARRAAG